ncbi:MAG: hypothetical protein ABFS45_22775 [Pseudomonadota bacterium]
MKFLEKRTTEAQKKITDQTTMVKECATERESLETEILELEAPNETSPSVKNRKKGIGRKIVKAADNKLLQGEQLGLFTSFPISDKNSIPTLLARLPIFIPVPASKQAKLLDLDLSYPFKTPFGRGRRFGPPVTIEDEDVLFSMLQLSERRLIGKGTRLPIPLENDQWLRDENGNLTVQVTIATVGQINNEIGWSRSGKNYKKTLASIKRLAHVSIELETRRKDTYLGESWNGENIRLVDIKWRAYEEEGLVFAQFSPIMVKWLREQATYYNWSVRRQLKSSNGRALHRFLSTQGKHYRAELDYIADAIEWDGDRDRIRPRMEAVMRQLRDNLDWCDYEITGTGRTTPFILEFWRRRT